MTESSTSNAGTGEAGVEQKQSDYRVGYGRPPVEHRFKPGNRANPKGRGKKTRNRKIVVGEVLAIELPDSPSGPLLYHRGAYTHLR